VIPFDMWRHNPQEMSSDTFPHFQMKDFLVNIPKMYPGDTVQRLCNINREQERNSTSVLLADSKQMCHAVEVEQKGKGVLSVIYVVATPTTVINSQYMRGQLKDFLDCSSPERLPGRML
jgi:hypothetical protein